MGRYDSLTIGSIVSEKTLETENRHIHNNSLIAVPTGRTSDDGTLEYEIAAKEGGATLVNGKPAGTVFGADYVVAHESPALAVKWDMGIPIKSLVYEFTGSSYLQCTATEETLEIGTGTDANAELKVKSIQRVRYLPGAPLYMKFTAAFPKLADSNGDYTLHVGFYDFDNGLVMTQRRRSGVIEYGVSVIRDATATFYPFNGTIPDNIDFNNLNVYRIDTGYLGIAPTNLYIYDHHEKRWVLLHRQIYEQRITNVKTPDLPVGAWLQNEGNTLDIKILNGSIQAGTINGAQEEDPAARTKTVRTLPVSIPNPAVDSLIIAFRNPVQVTMYDRIDATLIPRTRVYTSTIASALFDVEGVLDGQNKSGSVDLYVIPSTDVLTGTFTPVELGYSILETSLNATFSLANAEFLEAFPFNSVGGVPLRVINTLDLLFPGQTALFVVNSTSTAFEITWKIKYKDRF